MFQKEFILNKSKEKKNNNNNNNNTLLLSNDKNNINNNIGLTQSLSLLNKKTNELDIKINELNTIFNNINNNNHVIIMKNKMNDLEIKMDLLLNNLKQENEQFNIKNTECVVKINNDFDKFKKYTLDIYHEVLEIKNMLKKNETNNSIKNIMKDLHNITQNKPLLENLNIEYDHNFTEHEKDHINNILEFLNE